MGVINFGISKELVNKIMAVYPIDNFIETGTYHGGTSFWASQVFKNVHTIEIAEVLYKSTSEKYKHVNNIHFHLGDSKDVLKDLIPKIEGPALFWLDGHWCGRETGGKENLCPVMNELKYATSLKGSVIFIDDLRCFLGPMPFDSGEEYPPIFEIIDFLRQNVPNHYITFHDDTIIAVPEILRSVVDKDWTDNYSKRFPNTVKNRFSKLWWRIKNMNFTNEYS